MSCRLACKALYAHALGCAACNRGRQSRTAPTSHLSQVEELEDGSVYLAGGPCPTPCAEHSGQPQATALLRGWSAGGPRSPPGQEPGEVWLARSLYPTVARACVSRSMQSSRVTNCTIITKDYSGSEVHCATSYSLAYLSEAHAALQGHVVIRHPASSNWEEPLDVEHLHGHGAEAGRVSLCVFFLGVLSSTDFCLACVAVSCLSQNSYARRKIFFEIKEHVAPQKWMTRC